MSVLRMPCPFCAWARTSTPDEERHESLLVIHARLLAEFRVHLRSAHALVDVPPTRADA